MRHSSRTRPFAGPWGAVAVVLILFCAALLAAWLEPVPEPIFGSARASDGDSLVLGSERIRLLGVDAPELGQACTRPDGQQWPCGAEARRRMTRILEVGLLRCEPDGRDRYGRLLAVCHAGETDIGAAIVGAGFAVADGRYGREERAARAAKRGIWSGAFQPPQSWRDEQDGGGGLLRWLFGSGS